METVNPDEDELEDTDDDDEDEEETPSTPRRKKRVSGLVTLTGKPKTPQKTTPKKAQTKGKSVKRGTGSDVHLVPASDEEVARSAPKPRSRPKGAKSKDPNTSTKPAKTFEVPDSAGEANDVWIISSDED